MELVLARGLGLQVVENGAGQSLAQNLMLVSIEMNAVDTAGAGNTAGVKEGAVQFFGQLLVSVGQACRTLLGTGKLICQRAARVGKSRWCHNHNGGGWHAGLYRCQARAIYQCTHALLGVPDIVGGVLIGNR